MRRLALALVVPLCSFMHQRVFVYTAAVQYQLDSISTVSALHHREEGACVTRWTETRSEDTRTFYLLAIGPADVRGADSVGLGYIECPDSEPTIHTHLTDLDPHKYDPYDPSVYDSIYVANHKAPLGLIVLAGRKGVIPYGVKP